MKVLKEGQCVNHSLYGIGIATESNQRRTTVDFYEHGVKKFITEMFQAQLVAKAPPRPRKARASAKSKDGAAKKTAAKKTTKTATKKS